MNIGIGKRIGGTAFSWSAWWDPPFYKKGEFVVRYGNIPELSTLFRNYLRQYTIALNDFDTADQATIDLWKASKALRMDIGINQNCGTNGAFWVNNITPNNQAYYQALDDAEAPANKGIQEFVTYNGKVYCLQTMLYPVIGDLGPGEVASVDFSTISGGSTITIVNPFTVGTSALYLDSTKGYAVDFPVSALDRWWVLEQVAGNTYTLVMNGKIPLEDYCGSAISGSHNYTLANQVSVIEGWTYMPNLTGLKYQYLENKRYFAAIGLLAPVSMGEQETGGYPQWSVLGNDWYDVMIALGYKGATHDPQPSAYDESYLLQRFRIPAGTSGIVTTACLTVQEVKEYLADGYAQNCVRYQRGTGLAGVLDITNWETILQWCIAKGLHVLSFRQYGGNFDKERDYSINMFPLLSGDLAERADGRPDGLKVLPAGITLVSTGGAISNGYRLEIDNAAVTLVEITDDSLYLRSKNSHKLSFYAKNDGTATDKIKIKGGGKELYFYLNSATYVLFEVDFRALTEPYSFQLNVPTWASAGKISISDIEILENEPVTFTSPYEPESVALFARMAALSVEPNAARKTIYNDTIKALKHVKLNEGYVNLFDKVIFMHTHAAHAEAAGRLSWKDDLYNLTDATTAPTYTVDKGWTLDGVKYLKTGFNPTSIAQANRRWTEFDGCLMVYINVDSTNRGNYTDIGIRAALSGARSMIIANYDVTRAGMCINGGVVVNASANPRTGMYGVSRITVAGATLYMIKGVVTTVGTAAGALTDGEFNYGAGGNTNRHSFGLCAVGLMQDEFEAFAQIVYDEYISKIGAI